MGKSVTLFYLDDSPDGRVKASLFSWTGLAYKIPRMMMDRCENLEALKQGGVYFLFGYSEETDQDVVYIGQAGVRRNGEGLLYRWQEHNRNPEKNYWTEAIGLTTCNDSLGPTEISYLEHRFYDLAKNAHRYKIMNLIDPTIGHLTEEKQCELEEYITYASLVVGALGHKVFVPIKPVHNKPLMLYCKSHYCDAKGYRTNDGFLVLRGSRIRSETTPSCPESTLKARKTYGDIVSEDFILKEDILFSSPSAAACFVCGASESGNDQWKTENGKKLKDVIESGEQ